MDLDVDAYERMQRQAVDPLGVNATLTIKLHNSGAMSIDGPVGDPDFCLHLLDEAVHAMRRHKTKPKSEIIVPGEDVDSRAKVAYL